MRRFEFAEGASNKFWEIELDGATFHVRFGRIGTEGQEKTTVCASDAEASKKHDALIVEKVKKGYVEVLEPGVGVTATQTSVPQSTKGDITVSIDGEAVSLATFARKNPLWFKKIDPILALARHIPGERPELPDHPAFAPWKDAVLRTGCRAASMRLGAVEGELVPTMSFCHGTTAFLEDDQWPVCKECEEPLRMCFQIAGAHLAPWLTTKKSLVGMYCFDCMPESSKDIKGAIYLALVAPQHEVHASDAGEVDPTESLTLDAPVWAFPTTSWLNFRTEAGGATGAFAALLGSSLSRTTGDAVEEVSFDDEYDGWVYASAGYKTAWIPTGESSSTDAEWRSAVGGYAAWDQADTTPKCRKCKKEMQFLLDYNGGQFVDGAMHVFVCDRGTCADNIQLAAAVEF